jgi:hypothetical protein
MPRSPKSAKPTSTEHKPGPEHKPGKRPAAPPQVARPSHAAGKKKEEKKPAPAQRIEIPLISTPNDQAEMERELEELFNEEKVTHRHGGTEPERD